METNQEKGLNYEIQIRDYIINELGKPAYLWSDTPEIILINCGIIGSHNQHRLNRINKLIYFNHLSNDTLFVYTSPRRLASSSLIKSLKISSASDGLSTNKLRNWEHGSLIWLVI